MITFEFEGTLHEHICVLLFSCLLLFEISQFDANPSIISSLSDRKEIPNAWNTNTRNKLFHFAAFFPFFAFAYHLVCWPIPLTRLWVKRITFPVACTRWFHNHTSKQIVLLLAHILDNPHFFFIDEQDLADTWRVIVLPGPSPLIQQRVEIPLNSFSAAIFTDCTNRQQS